MSLNLKIIEDLEAFSNGSWKKKGVTILTNPCFHSVCIYRLSSFMNRLHLVPLAKILWYFNRVLFSIDIDYRAELAGGFVLIHGIGTVIGKDVKSEGKLVVYQNVTLGGNQGRKNVINGKKTGQPYFANNVTIYTGASVFGPVYIKEKSVIKARQIVTEKNVY